jgi:hypothetical protein
MSGTEHKDEYAADGREQNEEHGDDDLLDRPASIGDRARRRKRRTLRGV